MSFLAAVFAIVIALAALGSAVFAIVIALAALGSAAGKLTKQPRIIETLNHVGVRTEQAPMLAALEIAGAVGVLVGFAVTWVGVLGALGLTLYFALAVVAHLRAGDKVDALAPAAVLTVVALVAMITRAAAG